MKEKSEIANVFKKIYTMVKIQFNENIRIFKSDNGREFFSKILGHFFLEKGIIQQSLC